jgi:CTP:molybdopterin cytidylyltransferase MocA
MSLKGKQFKPSDAPRGMTKERAKVWAEEQSERYRIVAMDGDTPVIAEELVERNLRKMSANARIAATEFLAWPLSVRREVLAALDEDAGLRNRLTPV